MIKLDRAREAVTDCNKSLSERPNDAYTLGSLGFAHLRAGEPLAALADFDQALNIRPRMATSLLGRSLAKRQLGDEPGAERDAASARAIKADVEADLRAEAILP